MAVTGSEAEGDKGLESVLGFEVIDHEGKQVKVNEIKSKILGLYFSAHWCPPCRAFTPTLAAVYKELKERDAPFEIVFISSDHDDEKFASYFGTMPWLALPFSDQESKKNLLKHFDVRGIPCLIIIDLEQNTMVTKEGRNLVSRLGAKAFPFDEAHVLSAA